MCEQFFSLDFWVSLSTIAGSLLSFIGIVATIWFGILTYRLTIKYGESEQEIKDLGLIIEELKTQNIGIIENSIKLEKQIALIEEHRITTIKTTSPRLIDVEMGILKMPPNSSTTHKYSVRVKNFGVRTAYNVTMKLFVLNKIGNTKINDTYGTLNTNEEIRYQHHAEPQQTIEINVLTDLPPQGFLFFKDAYIYARFECNDLMLGESIKTESYWKFNIEDLSVENLLSTKHLTVSEKIEVDNFIKLKGL